MNDETEIERCAVTLCRIVVVLTVQTYAEPGRLKRRQNSITQCYSRTERQGPTIDLYAHLIRWRSVLQDILRRAADALPSHARQVCIRVCSRNLRDAPRRIDTNRRRTDDCLDRIGCGQQCIDGDKAHLLTSAAAACTPSASVVLNTSIAAFFCASKAGRRNGRAAILLVPNSR